MIFAENSNKGCDTGSPLSKIAKDFPELDFSHVDPAYPTKDSSSPYAFTKSANKARGEACLKDLYNRPEKVIAVVSHAGFLRTAVTRRRYANADYRIFTFGKGDDGYLELFEDDKTARKGGGLGRSQKGIFEVQEWDFPSEEAKNEE